MEQQYLQSILINISSNNNEDLVSYINSEAKKVGSKHILYVNTEESLKIDQVRHLQTEVQFGSPEQVKIYVLSNIETASLPAMNALLKILEEPPRNILFILITKNIQQVLPTIQSRCIIKYLQTKKSEIDTTKIITDFSYQNIIAFAKENKTIADSQEVLHSMIQSVHKELEGEPDSQKLIHKERLLLKALQDLQTATSPQLVLEHCFFEMKKK